MRRATGQPLLSCVVPPAAVAIPAACLLLLAGCGGGAGIGAPASAPPTSTASTGSSAGAPSTEPGSDQDGAAGQGTLADGYAYTDESARTLATGEAVPVPFDPPADALGALTEVGVVMPPTGATTLACDLGADGSVALELTAEGGWTVLHSTDGASAELAGGVLEPGQRGEPGELTALRLLCSSSPDGLAVGVSLHGAGVTFVEGATGEVPPGGPSWQVSSTGQADVEVSTVLLTLVEA